MSHALRADAPPLREDDSGALRVGDSHVLLELVIEEFQDGATPEAIVQQFSTLGLREVYAVIAYYLWHQEEIDAYLARREQRAADIRQEVESRQRDLGDIRRRLLGQRTA